MAQDASHTTRVSVRGVDDAPNADDLNARPEARRVFVLAIIAVVVIVCAMLLPTDMSSYYLDLTPTVIINLISNNVNAFIGVFIGDGDLYEARFMVVVMCAVSGAALGLCGSAYQGAFNNPLAAPKTLGVMAGGALGSLIYVIGLSDLGPQMPYQTGTFTYSQGLEWLSSLNPLEWLWVNYGMCLCSILGCFLVVGIVLGLTSALGRGRLTNIIVIIFGQIFAVAVTAIISFFRYLATCDGDLDTVDALKMIENYTMMRNYHYYDLLIMVVPIVICIVIVLLMSRRLTLLSFGDDEAASMGINVNKSRYVMIIVCTIMTALSISFCGHVAFLGFISAHIARRIVGPDFKYLLPASLLTGATLLSLLQYLAQSGIPFVNMYSAGSLCSIVGSIIFLCLVVVEWRKGGAGGW